MNRETAAADTPVAERLKRRIAMTGPITVADYMAACLTDPGGYYARRDPFGVAGDFITAPEISQMFGEIVGAFLLDRWHADGCPEAVDLVELGPGRGTLMADILRVVARDAQFMAASQIVLVEASHRLRQVQRDRLARAHPRIVWADEATDERPIYLVANEFFDALPVRQLVCRDGRWFERTVGFSGDALAFGLSPFPVPREEAAPEGAVRELRPAANALTSNIGRTLARHGAGTALIVDYGHCGTGFGDTLQAVRGHAPVDVLDRPGESDLSAHVDFSALAAAARSVGAHAHGPVDQGAFLLALGLPERAGKLGAAADDAGRSAIETAVRRLAGAGEGEMGALFKVLAVTSRPDPPPGF